MRRHHRWRRPPARWRKRPAPPVPATRLALRLLLLHRRRPERPARQRNPQRRDADQVLRVCQRIDGRAAHRRPESSVRPYAVACFGATNNGTVNWTFAPGTSGLDFLRDGQTSTIVFAITLADGKDGTARQKSRSPSPAATIPSASAPCTLLARSLTGYPRRNRDRHRDHTVH